MKHYASVTACLLGLALWPGAHAACAGGLRQTACLAPQLRAADGAAADLFVEKTLALYPDVLNESRFAPARFAHIQSVIKTYYWFVNGQFDELYACLPEAQRQKTTPQKYRALLEAVARLYQELTPQQRAELETAIILHDIGYPGGIEREHPQRGADLAARILPPGRRGSVPLLIRIHGIEMGMERLPDEFNAIRELTEANKIQLFFLWFFDNTGKVRSEQGAAGTVFKINNAMPPQSLGFSGALLLSILENKNNGPLRDFADPAIDLARDFHLFQLRLCFGSMAYSTLTDEEYQQIREALDRLVGPEGTPARAIFDREWNRRLKSGTFTVFLNMKRLDRADRFDLIVRLASAAARKTNRYGHDGPVAFRTDVDYLSGNVQREYQEEFALLAALLAEGKPIPLVYDGKNREVVLRFKTLRKMLAAEKKKALDQAA